MAVGGWGGVGGPRFLALVTRHTTRRRQVTGPRRDCQERAELQPGTQAGERVWQAVTGDWWDGEAVSTWAPIGKSKESAWSSAAMCAVAARQRTPHWRQTTSNCSGGEGAFFCWDLELGVTGCGYLIGLSHYPSLDDFQGAVPSAENQVQGTYNTGKGPPSKPTSPNMTPL